VDRISVGRAHNNDIVLRHSSVSKFHAWLECDEGRVFYVGDAKSKNGTKVNGEAVAGELHRLAAGDEIRFGQVVTTICPPDLFWDVVAEK
jgi:pSer/pThr/pTyr-binding forkhead associated (FHA) protein